MVAYSFQRRFIVPIQAGTKVQTIRAIGKRRHASVGQMLQIYFGMRTQYVRKIIDDKPCLRVDDVELCFRPRCVVIGDGKFWGLPVVVDPSLAPGMVVFRSGDHVVRVINLSADANTPRK